MSDEMRRPDFSGAVDKLRGLQQAAAEPARVDRSALDKQAKDALFKLRRRHWDEQIPAIYREARLDDFIGRPGHAELTEWANDPTCNLLLLGPVGVGKTHAATAAVRPSVGRSKSVMWRPVGELLDALDWRNHDSSDQLQRAMTVDMLVLDDLGTERSNEWTGERIYTLLNRRMLDARPTVATTNHEPDELAEALGERTFSRLVGGALVIRLAGPDRRRTDG